MTAGTQLHWLGVAVGGAAVVGLVRVPLRLEERAAIAVISGIVQQQKLYAHLGFEPFGPLIGTPEAQFQPMMLTLERFAPRAQALFRHTGA